MVTVDPHQPPPAAMMPPRLGAPQPPVAPASATEDWFLDGGYRNRILLALESQLPNEVDWAFNKLVRLSFICTDNISLAIIPGIMDAVMLYAQPYTVLMRQFRRKQRESQASTATTTSENAGSTQPLSSLSSEDPAHSLVDYSLFNPAQLRALLTDDQVERTLQILHIFRNFSFIEANLMLMTKQIDLLEMIHLTLPGTSPGIPKYQEMRRYALDILENLSPKLTLTSSQDLLIGQLVDMMLEDDRAVIVGAMRTWTRLVMNENNEMALSDVDPRMVQRLMQLIFVWDEELVASIMDLLYHYTNLYGSVGAKIAQVIRSNIVKILIKFLAWKWRDSNSGSVSGARPPTGLDVDSLACYEWWKTTCEADTNSFLPQIELYQAYCKAMGEKKRRNLTLPEFFRIAQMVFPQISGAMQIHNNNQRVVVRGIRAAAAAAANNQQDMSSIPLSAALILRNLARNKDTHEYFVNFEGEITAHAVSNATHESVARVLTDILAELNKEQQ